MEKVKVKKLQKERRNGEAIIDVNKLEELIKWAQDIDEYEERIEKGQAIFVANHGSHLCDGEFKKINVSRKNIALYFIRSVKLAFTFTPLYCIHVRSRRILSVERLGRRAGRGEIVRVNPINHSSKGEKGLLKRDGAI